MRRPTTSSSSTASTPWTGPGQGPGQAGVAVADHAVGRRDQRDGDRAQGALPHADRPAQRRHLLRHAEPAGRGQGDRRASPSW